MQRVFNKFPFQTIAFNILKTKRLLARGFRQIRTYLPGEFWYSHLFENAHTCTGVGIPAPRRTMRDSFS